MHSGSDDNRNKRGIGFRFAWAGIMVMKKERNFRIHMVVAFLVIVAGITVQLSTYEWSIIVLTIGMVMTLEMVNTSIETLLDYVQSEPNSTVKVIKDITAGAVLVAAIIAVVIGLLIFLPKLYHLF